MEIKWLVSREYCTTCFLQFADADFNNSKREYPDKNRYCTKTLIYKKLPNGENILRKWMVYSLSKGSLFSAICKLFGADNKFGYEGFNDWKNGNNRIVMKTLMNIKKT